MKKAHLSMFDGAGARRAKDYRLADSDIEIKQTRNLWPWGIIATFILFLSGTASLVVMACSQKVDLVSADYYEQEVRFQRHLDRLNHTRELQRPAFVRFDAATQRLLITLPPEQNGKVTNGQIHLYRPSTARLDERVMLKVNDDGQQSLDASALHPGFWKVRVAWTCAGQDYFAEEGILVGKTL